MIYNDLGQVEKFLDEFKILLHGSRLLLVLVVIWLQTPRQMNRLKRLLRAKKKEVQKLVQQLQ